MLGCVPCALLPIGWKDSVVSVCCTLLQHVMPRFMSPQVQLEDKTATIETLKAAVKRAKEREAQLKAQVRLPPLL